MARTDVHCMRVYLTSVITKTLGKEKAESLLLLASFVFLQVRKGGVEQCGAIPLWCMYTHIYASFLFNFTKEISMYCYPNEVLRFCRSLSYSSHF